MSPRRDRPDYDALTLVLSVAAFGLAILPVVLVAGGDAAVVAALGSAYGAIVAVVAPLYARRQERQEGRDRDDDGDGGERGE